MLLNLIDQLQIIHKAGLVHNNLKPNNIVIGSNGFRLINLGESVSFLNEGRHYAENKRCEHAGNLLMSTANKLSDMHPSRKNDMISLFYSIAVILEKLPYQDYFLFNNGRIPYAELKASLLLKKKNCTAVEYCNYAALRFMRSYL